MWDARYVLVLETPPPVEEGLSSDWLPGVLLVLVLVGLWFLWRRARATR